MEGGALSLFPHFTTRTGQQPARGAASVGDGGAFCRIPAPFDPASKGVPPDPVLACASQLGLLELLNSTPLYHLPPPGEESEQSFWEHDTGCGREALQPRSYD